MNRETEIHIYIHLRIKYIARENLLSNTGNSTQYCGGLNKQNLTIQSCATQTVL